MIKDLFLAIFCSISAYINCPLISYSWAEHGQNSLRIKSIEYSALSSVWSDPFDFWPVLSEIYYLVSVCFVLVPGAHVILEMCTTVLMEELRINCCFLYQHSKCSPIERNSVEGVSEKVYNLKSSSCTKRLAPYSYRIRAF